MIIQLVAFMGAIDPTLLVVGKLATGVGKGLQAIQCLGKGIRAFVNHVSSRKEHLKRRQL